MVDAFNNSIIWIIGGSSGIGASLACNLAGNGGQIIISARRKEKLEQVSNSCEGCQFKPFVFPFDIAELSSHQTAVEFLLARYGRIDSVVLTAAMTQRSLATATSFNDTKDIISLNFLSYVHFTRMLLVPFMDRLKGQVRHVLFHI